MAKEKKYSKSAFIVLFIIFEARVMFVSLGFVFRTLNLMSW